MLASSKEHTSESLTHLPSKKIRCALNSFQARHHLVKLLALAKWLKRDLFASQRRRGDDA
jgi:hypothetical protein